jgi:hypothetical protein
VQFDIDKLSEPKNKKEKITNDLIGSKMSSIEELKHKIADIKNQQKPLVRSLSLCK